MSLSNLIPAPLRAYAALGLVICVVASLSAAYFTGRSHGWDAHVVVAEREKALQEAANQEAVRRAGDHYQTIVDAIELDKERLSLELAQLRLDAAADPRAAECGIGAPSSLRLNAIR